MVGFLDKNDCGVAYNKGSQIFSNELKNIAEDYLSTNIQSWFMFDNYNCQYNVSDPYSTPYAYYPYQQENCNPHKPNEEYEIPNNGICLTGNQTLNKTNAIANLNNSNSYGLGNYHIVYHLQHSGISSMGISRVTDESFGSVDFDNLSNGIFNQIMFSNGCSPATFNKDCIGEHYIENSQGGGVAFIGNSDVGWYGEQWQFKLFCDALYETIGHPATASNLGVAFQKAQGTSFSSRKRLTLLGDPEMPVWTKTPQTLNISVSPTSLQCGASTIVVTVSNLPAGENATICLQKGEEDYMTDMVSSNGSYSYNFNPRSSGQVDVTVTAHNFIPHESIITVNSAQSSNIFISDLTFDDDKTDNSYGNNDQQIDAGETIELTIELENNGTTDATSVSATLSCSSPYVASITNSSSSYGDIDSGTKVSSTSKYVFTIDEDAPELLINNSNPLTFSLQITDGANSFTDEFNIDVYAPEIEHANKFIITSSDGDLDIETNETITFDIELFNKGKAQATGVSAVLSPISTEISSCSALARNYPDIDKHGTELNTSAYQFAVLSNYVEGADLHFSLQVENEYGRDIEEFQFNLLDIPEKVDLTTIGSYSYKDNIKLYWDKPSSNVVGYNIYRSDNGINGSYNRLNVFLFESSYFDDIDLSELTTYHYKVAAVSPSGIEGEHSDPFAAWTTYSQKGLFPIHMDMPGAYRIESSINACDIDNDNKKEIFTSIRVDEKNAYLIGLQHDGTELYDIDGNVTTYSGFVHIDGNVESPLAIGDLDNSGNFQVVSATRDESNPGPQVNYFYSHSVVDNDDNGIPDQMWKHTAPQKVYRGPVIANIDDSTDGTKEVIYNCESGIIRIYNHQGQLITSLQGGHSYGALAVADIDNDGDKEIIAGSNTGIYIWHHNGANYGSSQPFYTLSGYNLRSSMMVCDLDNDGDKEILTSALKVGASEGRIVVLHHDGTTVSGWNGTQTISFPNDWYPHEISVGDMDNDGWLEVIALGTNSLKVWDNTGNQISSIVINDLIPGYITPLLADVDNDSDIEIVFASSGDTKIEALNMDGSNVLGFPILIDEGIIRTPCITDVDNNGKSELIVGAGANIYMWETNGFPELIEKGCERYDCCNTGEYVSKCDSIVIDENMTWSNNRNLCSDIIINSGILTITSSSIVNMSDNTKVIIRSGGELRIDAGTLMNTGVRAESGAIVKITNNGCIEINDSSEFEICSGAVFENLYGRLDLE